MEIQESKQCIHQVFFVVLILLCGSLILKSHVFICFQITLQ